MVVSCWLNAAMWAWNVALVAATNELTDRNSVVWVFSAACWAVTLECPQLFVACKPSSDVLEQGNLPGLLQGGSHVHCVGVGVYTRGTHDFSKSQKP